VIEGRSKQVFKDWLEARAQAFRDSVEVVAMDGFTGYKSAAVEAIDTVVTVMDPYHVVALVGDKLDQCRQRIQQETLGHRGRFGDPLYGIRRVARTRAALLTEKQQHRLLKVLTDERHAAFEATWSVYQDVISAYQADDPTEGKAIMARLIDSLRSGVPAGPQRAQITGQNPAPPTRRHPRDLRPPRHVQRPQRSDQRPAGTPPRDSQRVPQHRQLHRPMPTRRGRVQTHDPLTSVKSR